MTLDEAIKHAEEVAKEKDMQAGFDTDYLCYQMSDTERNQCKKCAKEHRQLAEWLEDYKRLLDQQPCDDAISREDAYKIVMMPDTPFGKHKGILIRELLPVTPQQKYGN